MAKTKRCGFGDAYRSDERTSGEIAVFVASTAAAAGSIHLAVAVPSARPAPAARNARRLKDDSVTLLSCPVEVRFQMSGQETQPVSFTCNGAAVTVATVPGESLLS